MNTMLNALNRYRAAQALHAMLDVLDCAGYVGNDPQALRWLEPAYWGAPIESDTRAQQARKNYEVALWAEHERSYSHMCYRYERLLRYGQ